jgi:hypothetical protein
LDDFIAYHETYASYVTHVFAGVADLFEFGYDFLAKLLEV